jgi:hypothetical protein
MPTRLEEAWRRCWLALPRSALPLSLALGTLLLARRALQLLRRALQQTLLACIWLVS